jgi:hypothetical protein
MVLLFLFKFIGAVDCGLGFDTVDSEPVTPDNTVYDGYCTISFNSARVVTRDPKY